MAKYNTFICVDCSGSFPIGREGMGMSMGGGQPEYWCDRCRPPATSNEIIDCFKTFIDPKIKRNGT